MYQQYTLYNHAPIRMEPTVDEVKPPRAGSTGKWLGVYLFKGVVLFLYLEDGLF